MKVYNNVDDISFFKNRAITVGTFDGVHIGHQSIINTLKNQAVEKKMKSMLITFEPHPQIFLNKNNINNFPLLTTIEERIKIFSSLEIDELLILPFDNSLATLTAIDFICELLHKKIGFSIFIIGFNHSFGKNRQGNYKLLFDLFDNFDAEILRTEPVLLDGLSVSSTIIRQEIMNKNLELANKMLGREYFLTGKVVKGNGLGKKIGFPTANLSIENNYKLIPNNGVYFCKVIIDNEIFYGMANIGTRPTFFQAGSKTIEVNIFNMYRENIYDETIEIYFLKFIRDEKKFSNVDELTAQIHIDEKKCRELISSLFI